MNSVKHATINETQLFVRWTLVSIVAETVGVAIALLVFTSVWEVVVAVAILEPLLLGLGQRWILRAAHPGLERGWLLATVLGAMLGRCVEIVADSPGVGGAISVLPPSLQPVLTTAAGALVGGLMAVPQAYVLRRHLEGTWLWIAVRAVAWAVAFPSLLLAVAGASIARDIAQPHTSLVPMLLVSCAVAGAFVGVVEGIAMERLIGTWRDSVLPRHGVGSDA
jgi:hypothetical protein